MARQRSMLCTAVLCLVASAGFAAGQAGTPAPAPAPAGPATEAATAGANSTGSQQQLLTFCVPMWQPLSICDPSQPSQAFTGYDVELVRSAAQELQLTEGKDYTFKCVDFQTLISSLTNASGPCSASTGGVSITSEREQAGVMFTYPTTKLSLGILVQSYQTYSGGWGFTRPFSWSLWLALLLTLLIFPVIIFCIEFFSLRRRIHRDDVRPGILESGWRSALTLMLFDSFMVTSLGARVAVLAFMFLALLVTSTYTANLAAFVTVQSIKSAISGVEDLRGKAVGTSPIYMDRLRKYGLQPTPYPFNKGSDYLVWRDLVASGELSAVIRDLPSLQWLADTAPNCEVTVLQQTLEPFDYGIAFHANSSDALVDKWTGAVLRLQEAGTLKELYDSWITSPETGCQTDSQVNQGAQSVAFNDLYGLWIILASGIGLGALLMIAQRTMRHYKKHASLRRSGGGGGGQLDGSPMPEGRRPLRLLSAMRAYLPRQPSAKWTASSRSGRKGGRPGSTANGTATADSAGRPAGALRTPRTPDGGGAPDLESQATAEASSLDSPSAASSQAQPWAAAAAQASPSQQAPRRTPSVQRASALQAADSIYSAVKWKSVLRQGVPKSDGAG